GDGDLRLWPQRQLLQSAGHRFQRTRRKLLAEGGRRRLQRVLVVAVTDREQRCRERALGPIGEDARGTEVDLESQCAQRLVGNGREGADVQTRTVDRGGDPAGAQATDDRGAVAGGVLPVGRFLVRAPDWVDGGEAAAAGDVWAL